MSLSTPHGEPEKVIKISSKLSVGLFPDGRIMTMIDGKPFVQCRKAIITAPSSATEDSIAARIGNYSNFDEFLEKRTSAERLLDFSKHVIEPEVELFVHASSIQGWVNSGYNIDIIDSRIAFPILLELSKTDARARNALFYEAERRWREGSESSRKALEMNPQITPVLDMIKYRSGDATPAIIERMARNPFAPGSVLADLARSKDVSTRMYVASNPNIPKQALKLLVNDKDKDVLVELSKNHGVPKETRKTIVIELLPEMTRAFWEGDFDEREVLIDFFLENEDIQEVEMVKNQILSSMVNELVEEDPVITKIDYLLSTREDFSGLEMAVFGQYYIEYSEGKSIEEFKQQLVKELVEEYGPETKKDYNQAPGDVIYGIVSTGKAMVADLTDGQVMNLVDYLEDARGKVYRKYGRIIDEDGLKKVMPEYKFIEDNFAVLMTRGSGRWFAQVINVYPKMYANKSGRLMADQGLRKTLKSN